MATMRSQVSARSSSLSALLVVLTAGSLAFAVACRGTPPVGQGPWQQAAAVPEGAGLAGTIGGVDDLVAVVAGVLVGDAQVHEGGGAPPVPALDDGRIVLWSMLPWFGFEVPSAPDALTPAVVLEVLAFAVGGSVTDGVERYGATWSGLHFEGGPPRLPLKEALARRSDGRLQVLLVAGDLGASEVDATHLGAERIAALKRHAAKLQGHLASGGDREAQVSAWVAGEPTGFLERRDVRAAIARFDEPAPSGDAALGASERAAQTDWAFATLGEMVRVLGIQGWLALAGWGSALEAEPFGEQLESLDAFLDRCARVASARSDAWLVELSTAHDRSARNRRFGSQADDVADCLLGAGLPNAMELRGMAVRAELERTLAEREADAAPPSLAARGAGLHATLGCAACHSTQRGEVKVGPSHADTWGRTHTFPGGERIEVTAEAGVAYLRESIREPSARIVPGFNELMPSYEGRLPDDGLDALVAYIQCLGGGEPHAGTCEGVTPAPRGDD